MVLQIWFFFPAWPTLHAVNWPQCREKKWCWGFFSNRLAYPPQIPINQETQKAWPNVGAAFHVPTWGLQRVCSHALPAPVSLCVDPPPGVGCTPSLPSVGHTSAVSPSPSGGLSGHQTVDSNPSSAGPATNAHWIFLRENVQIYQFPTTAICTNWLPVSAVTWRCTPAAMHHQPRASHCLSASWMRLSSQLHWPPAVQNTPLVTPQCWVLPLPSAFHRTSSSLEGSVSHSVANLLVVCLLYGPSLLARRCLQILVPESGLQSHGWGLWCWWQWWRWWKQPDDVAATTKQPTWDSATGKTQSGRVVGSTQRTAAAGRRVGDQCQVAPMPDSARRGGHIDHHKYLQTETNHDLTSRI